MHLTGRTQQLVHAYLAQWHELFRRPGPDLATFFDHVRKRVLLDNDPPPIRQGLCLVGMMITRELADAGKKLGEGDGGQYEAMHELFTQIAEGPEVTVEASTMDTPSQLGSRMGCGPGMILL